MKVRNGFISNSSSSSFVLVTTKSNFDRVLAESDEITTNMANHLKSERTFMGQDVVCLGEFSDAGGGGTFDYMLEFHSEEIFGDDYDDDDDDDFWDAVYDRWSKFKDRLHENKDEVLTYSMSD